MSECIKHKGELHLDTLLPIDNNGQHILYGYRLCANNECVNPDHITTNIRLARNKGLRPRPLFHLRGDITPQELNRLARKHEPGEPKGNCLVTYCIRPADTLHLCVGHYLKLQRWRKAQGKTKRQSLDITPVLKAVQPPIGANHLKPRDRYCHVEGCSNEYRGRGLCKKHLSRYEKHLKTNAIRL